MQIDANHSSKRQIFVATSKQQILGMLNLKNLSLKTGVIVSGITALVGGSAAALTTQRSNTLQNGHQTEAQAISTFSQASPSTGDATKEKPAESTPVDNTYIVNGQSVNVPANGSYHKTTTDGGSTTTVDITSQSSQNGSTTVSNSSSSTSNVSVQSYSKSFTNKSGGSSASTQ